MTGIPITVFDYFNLAEIPTFILCNPNKEQLYSLGGISERKYSPKFNALSELSFRADEYVDGIRMPYYDYLVYRRLIFIDGIGYFVIIEAPEDNDGIVAYKEVRCESLETLLSSKKLVIYISGSAQTAEIQDPIPVTLEALLLDLQEKYMPEWNFQLSGSNIVIPASIAEKYRSFDVADKSIYDFLITDVEETYGCVFDFDTIGQRINIYDPSEVLLETDIYISHNNVINNIKINEVIDEMATCLYVLGGNTLDIRYINPLGNNYIYNFDYFKNTNWMGQDLINSLDEWSALFISASPAYSQLSEDMYYSQGELEEAQYYYALYSGSIAQLNTAIEAAIEAGLPTEELESRLAEAQAQQHWYEHAIDAYSGRISDDLSLMANIVEELSFDNTDIFSTANKLDLQPFIIQSSYINENILQTETMSASAIYIYANQLYNQAKDVLAKVSEPKYTFEIESVNFMQIIDFEAFRDQIRLGCTINIEIREGTTASPILLGMDMSFDDPTDFTLTFGNRLRMDDESFKFKDLMSRAISAGNSNKIYAQQWNSFVRNYQSGVESLMWGVNIENVGNKEGVYINQGDSINLITPNLLWNNYPIAMGGGPGGEGLTEIKITLFSGGVSTAMFDPTADGLDSAIAVATPGDVIFLPDVEISGYFSIPAGVNLAGVSSRESIILGQVTIEPLCLLENLTVLNQQNTSTPIYAVIVKETATSTESSKIKGCEIYAYQCGSGSSIAVYIPDSGVVLAVENSTIVADSNDGLGYAFAAHTSAFCNVFHSGYYAKTEVFHDL